MLIAPQKSDNTPAEVLIKTNSELLLGIYFESCGKLSFEAEKKVAVADTSIFNLQRSVVQIEEEQKE